MEKKIIEELKDLRENVQSMREEGEGDLRSVLAAIDAKIRLFEKE